MRYGDVIKLRHVIGTPNPGLFANSFVGGGQRGCNMIKLISSQSDRPLSKRLDDDLPIPPSDGGAAVGSAGGIVRTSALRKLLVLVETQPRNWTYDFCPGTASPRGSGCGS